MNSPLENQNRMAVERSIISHLVQTALAAGWTVPSVWDGEDNVPCVTEQEVLDAVFSVDESTIRIRKDGHTHRVVIVLGNDGYDCICDNSLNSAAPGAPDFEGEVIVPSDAYALTLQEALEGGEAVVPSMG